MCKSSSALDTCRVVEPAGVVLGNKTEFKEAPT